MLAVQIWAYKNENEKVMFWSPNDTIITINEYNTWWIDKLYDYLL